MKSVSNPTKGTLLLVDMHPAHTGSASTAKNSYDRREIASVPSVESKSQDVISLDKQR